jgi:hypothetical protein
VNPSPLSQLYSQADGNAIILILTPRHVPHSCQYVYAGRIKYRRLPAC